MKKLPGMRIVSLAVCLSVVCGCIALGLGSLTAASYDDASEAYRDVLQNDAAPSSDADDSHSTGEEPMLEQLEAFLAHVYSMNLRAGQENVFDGESSPDRSFLSMLLQGNAFEMFYPDAVDNSWFKSERSRRDPQGIWKGNYEKTNADQVDWVVKNIFGYSDADISDMRLAAEKAVMEYKYDGGTNGDLFYEYEGYYYHFYDGSDETSADIRILNCVSTEKDGCRYVEYTVGEFEDENAQSAINVTDFFAKAEYKPVDGRYYWTLRKNDTMQFWSDETVTEASETADAGEETTEADEGEKTGFVLDRSTLIPAALVVAAAGLIIAIAVILARKRRREKAQTQQEELLVQTPQQPLSAQRPQAAASVPAPPQVPRPVPPAVRICRDSGVGGMCWMCGQDVRALMRIDDAKGERYETRFYCPDCAGKIMRQSLREPKG